jgi:5'-deoxynucleotidase YfbR-like HD superfamily hydrolase
MTRRKPNLKVVEPAPALEPRPGCIGASIMTYTGRYFDLANPAPEMVEIVDIAHALSLICRYTGHAREFYSVAQHCVMASQIVPQRFALAALLHDAPEAYVGDMSSPLKQLCADYRAIEARVEAAVFQRFHIDMSGECKAAVKEADLRMLLTEKRDLTAAKFHEWPGLDHLTPRVDRIEPWSPQRAEMRFMNRFVDLCAAASRG